MSDIFKKDICELYHNKKLSDFEYNQLVCLNSMIDSLGSIDNKLEHINKRLSEIKYGLDGIASK